MQRVPRPRIRVSLSARLQRHQPVTYSDTTTCIDLSLNSHAPANRTLTRRDPVSCFPDTRCLSRAEPRNTEAKKLSTYPQASYDQKALLWPTRNASPKPASLWGSRKQAANCTIALRRTSPRSTMVCKTTQEPSPSARQQSHRSCIKLLAIRHIRNKEEHRTHDKTLCAKTENMSPAECKYAKEH